MNLVALLYEKLLLRNIKGSPDKIPGHITLVLSDTDISYPDGLSKLFSVISWYRKLGIEILSIYVNLSCTSETQKMNMVSHLMDTLEPQLLELPDGIGFNIYDNNGELKRGRKGSLMHVYLSLGFGGKSEIINAVLSILSDVSSQKLEPEDIDENVIESRLLVQHEPDMIIRAGGKNLSDFLIWQSVYSELYFTDVNWDKVRKIDMLRAIRDFQKRQRKFGK
ncbi:MAG: undecaprenyl diphosphate synthase family protein [Methanohalobium sp.]|uniref:undecaprenyl diphosphate synthase family protein n=1 Tax=Methanohalobium sp. TaxID=2837493 RepID=UPI0039789E98